MSSFSHKIFDSILLIIFLFFMSYVPQYNNAHPLEICKFNQIYQLGDSISDTGNLIREIPIGASSAFSRPPYGETFFKNATGRCSNGLLMIDYMAMAADLPFVPPYKNIDADFRYGVNFAVAGSTTLPYEVLASKNIFSPVTTSSLNVQLEWMSSYFNSICLNDRNCGVKLQNALFMVGEIGGNDYNYAIFQGKTMDELKNVWWCLENFQYRLPIYQTTFRTNISESYDDNQCLKEFNEFAMYHNEQLQQAIVSLKQEKPNAIIIYGDYSNAYQFLHEYGNTTVPVCSNPNSFMSWDGVHLTQEGYKIMVGWLVHNNIFRELELWCTMV
ncbi:hypothetical protein ACJIZ3_017827 [Penstemon smallii]|uniref:Acetylajmalan esterase-like n=1 Tax=Penstemon smallii TaxID=265156 RepID=A0ABD3SWN1_9LAMI